MSTKLSSCCVTGHLHNGAPQGKEEFVAGLKAYVTGDNKLKTILAITDIFGYQLNNVKLLADEYAKSGGFRVIVPDFFENDSVNEKHMKALTPLTSDTTPTEETKKANLEAAFQEVHPWAERHKDDIVRPLIIKVVKSLKADSEKLGIVGFCWGARHAILLGGAGSAVDAIVANHPSFTEFPTAFEDVTKPTLIQVGENDSMFPSEQVRSVKHDIFVKKAGCEVIVYPGAVHGFGVRADLNNDAEKKIKEDATGAALDFFQKHLQ